MRLTLPEVLPYVFAVGAVFAFLGLIYTFVAGRTWPRPLLQALWFERDLSLNVSSIIVLFLTGIGGGAALVEVIWPDHRLSNWGWGFISGGFFWTITASIPIDRAKILADVKKHQADVGAPDPVAPVVPITTTTTVGGPQL